MDAQGDCMHVVPKCTCGGCLTYDDIVLLPVCHTHSNAQYKYTGSAAGLWCWL